MLRPSGPRARLLLLALLLAAVAPTSARANLIVNGSFETGPAVSGSAMMLSGGSTAIAGWVVAPSNVDYVTNSLWSAAEGARSVSLNGLATGGISQTFTTIPRAQYTVRFYLAGDPGSTPAIKTMRVSAAGQFADYSVDITGMWAWEPGWDSHMFAFIANSNSTTLAFTSLMSGDTGPAVDSVTVALNSTAGVHDPLSPGLGLSPILPNPARGPSTVEFAVTQSTPLRVSVVDLSGREVAVLADGLYAPGVYHETWGAHLARGPAAPGVYFVRMSTPGRQFVQRLVLIR